MRKISLILAVLLLFEAVVPVTYAGASMLEATSIYEEAELVEEAECLETEFINDETGQNQDDDLERLAVDTESDSKAEILLFNEDAKFHSAINNEKKTIYDLRFVIMGKTEGDLSPLMNAVYYDLSISVFDGDTMVYEGDSRYLTSYDCLIGEDGKTFALPVKYQVSDIPRQGEYRIDAKLILRSAGYEEFNCSKTVSFVDDVANKRFIYGNAPVIGLELTQGSQLVLPEFYINAGQDDSVSEISIVKHGTNNKVNAELKRARKPWQNNSVYDEIEFDRYYEGDPHWQYPHSVYIDELGKWVRTSTYDYESNIVNREYYGTSDIRFTLKSNVEAGVYDLVVKAKNGTHVFDSCIIATDKPLVTGVNAVHRWSEGRLSPYVNNRGDYVSLYVYGVNLDASTAPLFYTPEKNGPISNYVRDETCAYEGNSIGKYYTVKKSSDTYWILNDDYSKEFLVGFGSEIDKRNLYEGADYYSLSGRYDSVDFPMLYSGWCYYGPSGATDVVNGIVRISDDTAEKDETIIVRHFLGYTDDDYEDFNAVVKEDAYGKYAEFSGAKSSGQYYKLYRYEGDELKCLTDYQNNQKYRYLSLENRTRYTYLPLEKGCYYELYSGNQVGRLITSGTATGNKLKLDEFAERLDEKCLYRLFKRSKEGYEEWTYIVFDLSGTTPNPEPKPEGVEIGEYASGQKLDIKAAFAVNFTDLNMDLVKGYSVAPKGAASVSNGILTVKKPVDITVTALYKGKKSTGKCVTLKGYLPSFKDKNAVLINYAGILYAPASHLAEGCKEPTSWELPKNTKVAELVVVSEDNQAEYPGYTVGDTLIKTLSKGNVKVTALYGQGKLAARYSFNLKVGEPKLSGKKLTLVPGEKSPKLKLKVTGVISKNEIRWEVKDEAGKETEGLVIESYVNDSDFANPVLSAYGAGKYQVTAVLGNTSYSCQVTVKTPSVSNKLTVKVGKTQKLIVKNSMYSVDYIIENAEYDAEYIELVNDNGKLCVKGIKPVNGTIIKINLFGWKGECKVKVN